MEKPDKLYTPPRYPTRRAQITATKDGVHRLVVYAWVPETLKRQLQHAVVLRHTTLSNAIVEALENWLEEKPTDSKRRSTSR